MNFLVIFSYFIVLSFAGTKTNTTSLTRIAPSNELHSGCDLFVTGIDNKDDFLKFFKELKTASAAKDQEQMVKLVNFPFNFNGSPRLIIKNQKDFHRHFSTLFTQKIFEVISKQQVDQLFCRDQCVMFGAGELWVGVSGKKIGIKSINHF